MSVRVPPKPPGLANARRPQGEAAGTFRRTWQTIAMSGLVDSARTPSGKEYDYFFKQAPASAHTLAWQDSL